MDRYENIFMSNRDAIMTTEPPTWRFTSGNPAAIKMFGAKNEADFLSYEPWRLSPEFQPDGQPSLNKAQAMIEKAVKEGSNFFSWVHKRTTGEEFPAEVLLSRVKQGDKIFLHASVRDITERVRLEKKLMEKQKEQEIILDSIPAWVFYKDDKNRFIRVNKAFAEVMGMTKDQLEGKVMSEIFPQDQAEAYWQDDKEVISSGIPKKNIIEKMNSSRGVLWVQTDKIPYRNEQGDIIGVIGFTVDITKKKLDEDKLKKNNEELEKLNRLMVGRELKMVELKEELERIKNQGK
ncbi:MAG TPA: PAS domain S-box protein [Candidatus Paceibacterota bacterium]|nr:PAS domain S-box protein [Candidatus Paceibacterota bacterium]